MSDITNTPSKNCLKCKKLIDAQDKFCRYCGADQSGKAPWYFQHWGIIILTLAVGPFALYNVVRSPVLGKTAKWIYTILILLFTIYAVYSFYLFMNRFNTIMDGLMQGNLEGFM